MASVKEFDGELYGAGATARASDVTPGVIVLDDNDRHRREISRDTGRGNVHHGHGLRLREGAISGHAHINAQLAS